ncbi:MAG TPA: O-antigen ligase family protein, partial [Lysobacter sp.]|nr:O-antigen ligase family protein [Lysobacter sp.]
MSPAYGRAGRSTALVGALGIASILFFALVLGALVAVFDINSPVGRAGMIVLLSIAGFFLLGIALLQAENPVRVAFFGLLCLWPYLSFPVPPGRFGLTVFDVLMLIITVMAIPSMVRSDGKNRLRLFQASTFVLVLVLTLPSVFMSQFVLVSARTFVTNFLLFMFFVLMIEEMRRPGGYMRMIQILIAFVFIDAAGVLFEAVSHINPSFRQKNINQIFAVAGSRGSGFFQDPQKAAQFIGCAVTLLSVMLFRGRFRDYGRTRLFAGLALLVSFAALITTGSRNAIGSTVLITLIAAVIFNSWPWIVKVIFGTMVGLMVGLVRLQDVLDLMPAAVAHRFFTAVNSIYERYQIWMDTWDMFASHPLQGIGLGAFRDYLTATRPTTKNFYGIGQSAGVTYVPDQPESGYLKILYEGGILTSLAVLILVVVTLVHAASVLRRGDVDARSDVIAASTALTVFGVT